MSDNSSNLSKSYWNGELVGNVNMQYRELINVDPDIVPYIDKLSLTSFFLKTRKGYVADRPMIGTIAENKSDYDTTDIKRIDNTGCKNDECFNIVYQVSKDKSMYRVLRRDCGDCNLQIIEEGRRCKCESTKFFDIDFPIGDIVKEGLGKQEYKNGVQSRFYDDFVPVSDGGNVSVGDYILFHSSVNSANPGQCGIYRQIIGIEDGYVILDTGYNEVDEETREGEKVGYKIFNNVGGTVGWVGSSSINVYHGSGLSTPICGQWSGCLLSVVNHNGILNVLTDKGYNVYGGIGENIAYFSGLQSSYVGMDKISSVSFGNFLVFLGKSSIEAMVFSENGEYSYKYNLSEMSYEDFGIYSKYSYSVFDNGLFLVGNDKRLYAVSIEGGGDKYYLKLDDQSKSILPDLDLLQKGDEIGLSSYQNKLYVFINGRLFDDNYNVDKTKILIFNKDYGLRYKHIVSWGVISGTKYGLFYGDSLYQYIGDRDVYVLGSAGEDVIHYAPIKSEIIFDIINSENHGIVNSLGNRVSLMSNKKINWMKFLLGSGIYTENTHIEIESYMTGYKFNKKIPFINNEWFSNWIEYFNGNYNNIKVSDCFSETLSKNDNMAEKYVGSKNNTDVRESLESPVCDQGIPYDINYESKRLDDYAICYNDKGYQLSPMKHVFINPQLKFNSMLYTVKIVSDNNDILNFGGAVVEYESLPVSYKDKSRYDIEIKCD